MELDDVYQLDDYMKDDPNNQPEPQNQDDPDLNLDDQNQAELDNQEDADFITSLLKKSGVDRHAIQIQDEEGNVEEVDFDALSEEEKMALYEQIVNNDSVLSDEEIKAVEYLRNNRMSLSDMIKWQRDEAVKEYLAQNQTQDYSVDKMTDDELYIFDLQDRYPDMTSEEIQQELDAIKANEALYDKKIAALRKEYKELEDQQVKQAKEAQDQEEAQRYEQLSQAVQEAASNTNEIHNLVLEDTDKKEVLDFLLERDANGQSEFYKLFSDPEKLFKLGWYALKGEEAFNSINDYYKGVIEKTRRQNQPTQSRTVRKPSRSVAAEDAFDLASQYKSI